MSTTPWEIVAVLTGVGFLVLAVRENPWCWIFGGVSTLIFAILFWNARLYMQSSLQVYYVGVAVYGWWHWRRGATDDGPLPVIRWPNRCHVRIIVLILGAGVLNGQLLAQGTNAHLPYLDALTTWGGVLVTWMAARKVLENWLYWLAINAAAVYLYTMSDLPLTAGLYIVYFVLALIGYYKWKKSYQLRYTKP